MKISLAQLNYRIGDFEGNKNKIIAAAKQAGETKLVVFSDMALSGSFPYDSILFSDFVDKNEAALNEIAAQCSDIPMLIGCVLAEETEKGRQLYNCAVFLHKGQRKVFRKKYLYSGPLCDELDYFTPFDGEDSLLEIEDMRIAVTIGNDLANQGDDPLLIQNRVDDMLSLHPNLIINMAASPFDYTNPEKRRSLLCQTVLKHEIPVVFVNQVGANTNIIYDGGSMAFAANGHVDVALPFFKEEVKTIDTDTLYTFMPAADDLVIPQKMQLIHDALVLGVSDYFQKMGFKSAIIGLSGGLDSALVTYFAVKALGADNVRVVLLPSQFSTDHSVSDAEALAKKLGIHYDIVPIKTMYDSFEGDLKDIFAGRPFDVTEENLQARIRGVVLMAISNKFGNILLNTSNKSEAAVGYGTLYGDMCGGLSVIGDVYKSEAYDLARYINTEDEIIPWHTINKAPSAELRPDQKDSDSLPDYDTLDKILFQYIECSQPAEAIIAQGFDPAVVNKTIGMVNRNEFKRQQVAPILRVSPRAFGPERVIPIVARF